MDINKEKYSEADLISFRSFIKKNFNKDLSELSDEVVIIMMESLSGTLEQNKSEKELKYEHFISEENQLKMYKEAFKNNDFYVMKGFEKLYTIDFDGVPYAISNTGNLHIYENYEEVFSDRLEHSKTQYSLTITRHHEIIKQCYDYISKQEGIGDVWCMLGGGSQLQLFYGNSKGYIAILYLSCIDQNFNEIEDRNYQLSVQQKLHNHIFENFDTSICNIQLSDFSF